LVPFRDGLILELESFTGSNYDGSNQMTSWVDMSGYGNTVYPAAPANSQYYPVYTASYFSGQPGIYFNATTTGATVTGSAMKTQTNLNGLSGSTGMTLFIVGKFEQLGARNVGVEYAKSGSSYNLNTGSFAWSYTLGATNNTIPNITTLGNVGLSSAATVLAYPTSSHVYAATIDYTLPIREAKSLVDNVSGSQTYTYNSNNTGTFEDYKLSIGAAVKDGQWECSKGYIGAVLLYNKVLTDSEMTTVYNYLSSSYL
jgi:hypothetical protein